MKEIERMWCARSGRGPGLLGTFACLAVMASLAAFSAAHEKKSGEPSGVLALDAAADGDRINLLLALRPPGAAGVKLQHVRSRDGGESWGSPTTILPGRAKIATPHRGADPQIIARGDTLVALWTEPGTSAWGSGPLATARSDDGGRTWSAGRRHWINATSPATGTG